MTIVKCTHNSFDHTGAIEFARINPSFPSHAFLLHDTSELTAESDQKIRFAHAEHFVTAASAECDGGKSNFLLCRSDYIRDAIGKLPRLINCSKLDAIRTEGILWKSCDPQKRAVYPNDRVIVSKASKVYDGVVRLTEFYTSVSIWKYKANWGQNWGQFALEL